MALGDPLQLEPISSLLYSCEHALRRHHGVPARWIPSQTSVQRIADQHTPIGTELPYEDDATIWVGCPLVVHRRCDEPMFSISNQIAYDGLMVQGKRPADYHFPSGAEAPDSVWIDVPATTSEGNWRPAEGQVLSQLVASLALHGLLGQDLIVFGPFTEVASRLPSLTRPIRNTRSGTVHVAQGQEADVVILVLGSKTTGAGAREWAAEKPNLLNVAVSRAKYRLYVIGSHADWRSLPHFRVMAEKLPVASAENVLDQFAVRTAGS